jgi:protein-tyrosine phosphatase
MKVKILMVCLGNICRSPLAEGILKSKLPTDKFIVDSAGTGWHSHHRTLALLLCQKKTSFDISQQKKTVQTTDFENLIIST